MNFKLSEIFTKEGINSLFGALWGKAKDLIDSANKDAKYYEVIEHPLGKEYLFTITGTDPIEVKDQEFSIFIVSVKLEGETEESEGKFSFFVANKEIESENNRHYLELKNFTLILGFDTPLIEPLDEEESHAKLTYKGRVKVYGNLKTELDGTGEFTSAKVKIGDTGITLGLRKFLIDNSDTTTPQELIDNFDPPYGNDFEGVYFEDSILQIEQDTFFPGFPKVDSHVAHAAFGQAGGNATVSFEIEQNFEFPEGYISETQMTGSLIYDEVKFAFDYINLKVTNNNLDYLNFKGLMQFPVLNNPIFKFEFQFQQSDNLFISVEKPESADNPWVISDPHELVTVSIEELKLEGDVDLSGDQTYDLKGDITVKDSVIKIDGLETVGLKSAEAQIKKTAAEELFSIEVNDLNYQNFTLKKAEFFTLKKGNKDLEVGFSGETEIDLFGDENSVLKAELGISLKRKEPKNTFLNISGGLIEPLSIEEASSFELSIEELNFEGELRKTENFSYHSIEGQLSGKLKLGKLSPPEEAETFALGKGAFFIYDSSFVKITCVTLNDADFLKDKLALEINKATFCYLKFTNSKKINAAYIELDIEFTNELDGLDLSNVQTDANNIEATAKFKYSWVGTHRSLNGTLFLKNDANIQPDGDQWNFLKDGIKQVDLHYSNEWDSTNNFQFAGPKSKITFSVIAGVKPEIFGGGELELRIAYLKEDPTKGHLFTVKTELVQQQPIEITEDNFKLKIDRLDLDGELTKRGNKLLYDISGQLSGALELLTDEKVIQTFVLKDAAFSIVESDYSKAISVEIRDFSFFKAEFGDVLDIRKATFYSVKYAGSDKINDAYFELDMGFDSSGLTPPAGVDLSGLELESTFKYKWGIEPSLEGVLFLDAANAQNPITNENDYPQWKFINDLISGFKEFHLFYSHRWAPGQFNFAAGEFDFTIIACLKFDFFNNGDLELELTVTYDEISSKEKDEYIFMVTGGLANQSQSTFSESAFELSINQLDLEGKLTKSKITGAEERELTGSVSGHLTEKPTADNESLVLENAEFRLKKTADKKETSIQIEDFSFIDSEIGTTFRIRKAAYGFTNYTDVNTGDETYFIIDAEIRETDDLPTLPENIDNDNLSLAVLLIYSKSGSTNSLEGTLELQNVDEQIIDSKIRVLEPEIKSLKLDYNPDDWSSGNFDPGSGTLALKITGAVTFTIELEEDVKEELVFLLDFVLKKDNGNIEMEYSGDLEGPVTLAKSGLFSLTVSQLSVAGTYSTDDNGKYYSLEGLAGGSLDVPDVGLSLSLSSAKLEIKESSLEKILSVKISDLAQAATKLGLPQPGDSIFDITEATFFYKKLKFEAEEEAYFEIKANVNLGAHPDIDAGDVEPGNGNDITFKYSWTSTENKLEAALVLGNGDQGLVTSHWDFIPQAFRPQIKPGLTFSYTNTWNKGTAFDFTGVNSIISLGTQIRIQHILDQIPLHEIIELKSGDEEGWITISLENAGGETSLVTRDPLELGFYIPGLETNKPAFVHGLDKMSVTNTADSQKFEMEGAIDLNVHNFEMKKEEDENNRFKINAEINIDKIPFLIGMEIIDGNPIFYFQIGVQPGGSEKDFISMLPGEMDGFMNKIFGDEALGDDAEPPEEKKESKEGESEEEKEKKILKKIILENKKLLKGKIIIDVLKLEIPSVKELLAEKEFSLHALTDVTTEFGPFYAKISNFGAKGFLKKNTSGSVQDNLKDLRIKFGLKAIPPEEAAFKIDAKAIKGGGYLKFDNDNHRYAGALSLNIKAIELTAVGLITTRLPNGQKGFSMLVSISVQFNPAIQLSFGFTLKGVGGLLGIHRTFKIEPMRARLASGSINSIMFPVDPINNIDKIISDLREVFPPKEKHYVIAPFVRIGWSEFVELDIGVLFELPFQGRLILLGSVGLYLPKKEKPILELHIDVLGDFNFAKKYIRIEGVLRDSGIKLKNNVLPLFGGFAFYLSWGAQPKMMFSAGGYHPRYKKPAEFPDVPRVGTILKYGDDLSISCELYTAVTSNSFQTGFKADLLAKFSGAVIKGYFSFDALIYFRPFYFETEIGMGVSVSYKGQDLAGIDLYFFLSGPKPWYITGRASIKVLLFKLEVDFAKTWGGEQAEEPLPEMPADDVMEKLTDELGKNSNWAARLPENFSPVESLRSFDDDQTEIIVHPFGFLEIRQQALPLKRSIEKYGQSSVPGTPSFELNNFKLGGASLGVQNTLREYFSRGQFEELSEEEKISTPDFELMEAGVRLNNSQGYEIPTDFISVEAMAYEDEMIGGDDDDTEQLAPSGKSGFSPKGKIKTAGMPMPSRIGKGKKIKLPKGGKIDLKKADLKHLEKIFGKLGKTKGKVGVGGVKLPDLTKVLDKVKNLDLEQLGIEVRKPKSLKWSQNRKLLRGSRRMKMHRERTQNDFMLNEQEIVFPESETYIIASKDKFSQAVNTNYFQSYSEAKDYLKKNGDIKTLQITGETAAYQGKKERNDNVKRD